MMRAPKTSPRPTARPSAPTTSPRPKSRPANLMQSYDEAGAVASGDRAARREAQDYRDFVARKAPAGKAKKMATGGMCRGMGKASKGGKFSKNG